MRSKKKRTSVPRSASKKLKVGSRVTVKLGLRRISGTIVDDMGRIGVGGRRIYSVRARLHGLDEEVFDVREDELRPSKRKNAA
jgi:hypothetical protein